MIPTGSRIGILALVLSPSLLCAPMTFTAEAGNAGRGWRGARRATPVKQNTPVRSSNLEATVRPADVRQAQYVPTQHQHFEPTGQPVMPHLPPPAPGVSTTPDRRPPVYEPVPVYPDRSVVMPRYGSRVVLPRRQPSLWDRRRPSRVFLFYDTQARRVGDLITVVISENTDVDNRESRELDKVSDDSGLLSLTSTTAGDFGASSASLTENGRASSTRAFDGSAAFSSARQFSDRITLTVVQVLPNGNLVIAGERRVRVAGDERLLEVSGIVRPIDVRADNTVQSRFVGDFRVTYDGDGVESHFTNQGWLSKITNKLWPF